MKFNFEKFLESNPKTNCNPDYLKQYSDKAVDLLKGFGEDLSFLLTEHGGCDLDKGALRIHSLGSSYYWTLITRQYFTADFEENVEDFYCFAFDWTGRAYAADRKGDVLYMFDPATGQYYRIKNNLEAFLNEAFVDFRDEDLLIPQFEELSGLYGDGLAFQDCIGFKVPLFLGGEDEPDNYEVISMDVYWELNYQLYLKVHELPEGTLIGKITFE